MKLTLLLGKRKPDLFESKKKKNPKSLVLSLVKRTPQTLVKRTQTLVKDVYVAGQRTQQEQGCAQEATRYLKGEGEEKKEKKYKRG